MAAAGIRANTTTHGTAEHDECMGDANLGDEVGDDDEDDELEIEPEDKDDGNEDKVNAYVYIVYGVGLMLTKCT